MPFLLDTCALSEFVVKKPDPGAVARLRTLPADETFLPAIVIGEINQGIEQMERGKRRSDLEEWLFNQIIPSYFDRIIPFGKDEAVRWGELRAALRGKAKPMQAEDSLIAAVALTHRLTLVTRNESDFKHCGVAVYNPWK